MTIQDVIKKAIEGGWNSYRENRGYSKTDGRLRDFLWREFGGKIFLDPSFWQALGKNLGWKDERPYVLGSCKYDGCYNNAETVEEFSEKYPKLWEKVEQGFVVDNDATEYHLATPVVEWKKHWHSFIDHLAEGKDINSYFENLK